MATGSYLTPNHSRSQSEIKGDLHICSKQFCCEENSMATSGQLSLQCIMGVFLQGSPRISSYKHSQYLGIPYYPTTS
ncbi:hypothetical protein TNCV_556601 [Trichonephila clavipes]|uniref:Uncharacterized protein n=1 Tax=Trichonephila clavipes TaxID=2585209 RepID=A0A8X6RVE0_TRICX|nr:hypothetical protein TNCV_556601 [Trichonephila clavipes]